MKQQKIKFSTPKFYKRLHVAEMGLCRRQTPCEPKQLGTDRCTAGLVSACTSEQNTIKDTIRGAGSGEGDAGLLCPETVGFDMCLAGELRCFSRSFQELAPDPRKGRQQTCSNFGQTVATICQSCLP
ncbi:hypothetical protein CDAR_294021 [Caerostris darwini]|uniref:Uncharacterized protein n=1 Tax=Caerostris darwini TaxID=1538125 RepID=A0AAV4VFV0_9ARAC|nr:hypothetical protein CDAR_294021 [Caerostris darwini]